MKHKYGNAQAKDLWAALEESTGKAIQPLMTTWTRQVTLRIFSHGKVSGA
ncbi:unnamed protein product [Choristocarpus tenellus]